MIVVLMGCYRGVDGNIGGVGYNIVDIYSGRGCGVHGSGGAGCADVAVLAGIGVLRDGLKCSAHLVCDFETQGLRILKIQKATPSLPILVQVHALCPFVGLRGSGFVMGSSSLWLTTSSCAIYTHPRHSCWKVWRRGSKHFASPCGSRLH